MKKQIDYTKIGMPDLSVGIWNADGTFKMPTGLSTPRKEYKIPGTRGSKENLKTNKDRAREAIRYAVNNFESRSTGEKISALESLPDLYKGMVKEDIKQLKEQRRAERILADNEYGAEIEKRVQDKIKNEYSDFNLDDAAKESLAKLLRFNERAKHVIGSFANDATDIHSSSILGAIDMNKDRQKLAQKYKEYTDLQEQLAILEHDRDTYVIPSKGSNPNYDEHLRFYDEKIAELKQALADPEFNAYVDLYKADYVSNSKGWPGKAKDWLTGAFNKMRANFNYGPYAYATLQPGEDRDAARNDYLLKIQDLQVERNAKLYDDVTAQKLENDQNYNIDLNLRWAQNGGAAATDGRAITGRDAEIESIKRQFDAGRRAADTYIKDRQREIDADTEEYKNTLELNQKFENYFQIPDEYRKGKEVYQDAGMLSLGYWFYEIPGILGSSNSSVNQQIGTAISYGSLAAALAAAPYSGGTSLAIYNAGVAAATPFQLAGGFEENEAERAEKKVDNITRILQDQSVSGENGWNDSIVSLFERAKDAFAGTKVSEEYLQKRYCGGKALDVANIDDNGCRNLLKDWLAGVIKYDSPTLRKADFESSKGLQALYDADNMRTMGETAIQKAIEFMPTGKLIEAGRGFIFRGADVFGDRILAKGFKNKLVPGADGKVTAEMLDKAISTKEGKEILDQAKRYSNGFRRKGISESFQRGFERGSELAAISGHGIAGTTIAGITGGTLDAGATLLKYTLNPKTRAIINKFEERAFNKYYGFYDKLMLKKDWTKLVAQYLGKQAKVFAIGGFSEGAEEAVQHLNSLENYGEKYGFNGMTLSQMIANDIAMGNKVADAYLGYLGLSDSNLLNDYEFRTNWMGGFALGAGHVASPRILVSSINGLAKDLSTLEELDKAASYEREADKISRVSYRAMAAEAMNGKSNNILNVLSFLQEQDSRRETPVYSQEAWDSQMKAADAITRLVKDKTVRQILERNGIAYGTNRYATAIADIYTLNNNADEIENETNNLKNDLFARYNSKEYQDAIQSISDAYRKGVTGQREVYERRQEIAKKAREYAAKEALKNGEDVNDKEIAERLDKVEKEAFDESINLIESQLTNYYMNKSRLLNRLMGLLKVRGQHNAIDDWYNTVSEFTGFKALRPDAKTIRENVYKQIKSAKRELAQLDENYDENSSDADTLAFIENDTDYVQMDSDNIQQLESAIVMLNAAKAVNDSHLNTLHNSTNRYAKRVDAIIKAEDDNAKLDTLINEIYNGDAVTELQKIFAKEDLEEKRRANKAAVAKLAKQIKESAVPFTDSPKEAEEVSKDIEAKLKETKLNLAKNKALYEKKKAKARESYLRRKNKYKNFKKRTAGMSVVPFEKQLVGAANNFMEIATVGAYKFEQFVEDMKEIASQFPMDELLFALKHLYIKGLVKYQLSKPEILPNLSTIDEILSYSQGPTKRVYMQPNANILPAVDYMQKVLQESHSKIDLVVSTYYDTFVNEDGLLTIYPNTSQTAIDMEVSDRRLAVDDTIRQLEEANTSDKAFQDKLEDIMRVKLQEGFPAAEYVKWRQVEGAIPAIARACNAWDKNDSIKTGIQIQNLVAMVLSGETEGLPVVGNPEEYNILIEDLKGIKDSLDAQGYKVIDSGNVVYGTDKDGNNLSSTADIILAHKDTGEVYVIDVRSSYLPIASSWDSPISIKLGIHTTVGESLTKNLHQIERILSSGVFRFDVSRLGVIPVLFDRWYKKQTDHIKLDSDIISVPTELQFNMEKEEQELKELSEQAQRIVDSINDLVDEYNNTIDEYLDTPEISIPVTDYKENISLLQQPDVESYNEYLQQLSAWHNDIVESLENLQKELYKAIDKDRQEYDEIITQQDPELIPQSVEDRIIALMDACRKLDTVASLVPLKKATTDADKEAITALYSAIFDAQVALDDVLEHNDDVDVREEEELIASVMENLAEQNENFKHLNKFVLRWWLTNFSKDVSSNTSTPTSNGKRYFAYLNKIKSWVDTLDEHVLNDLDDHPKLKMWYTSLLNNHLKQLVDNFEALEVEDIIMNDNKIKTINEARELIDAYNVYYYSEPYPISFDSAEEEKAYISSMNVIWMDHHGKSESHSPAYDSMKSAGKGAYADMSRMADFLTSYITLDMNIKDDPNHTTRLTFWKNKAGEIILTAQYWDKQQNRERFADLKFEIDIEAAKRRNLSEDTIQYFKDFNRGNRKFTELINRALEYIKKHPEEKITFTAFLNKGSILYDESRTPHNVSEWLFTGKNTRDLYTISLSGENNLGISKYTYTKSGDVYTFYDVYTGENLEYRLGSIDDEYTKQLARTETGLPVFFRDMGDGKRIATPLIPESLSPHATAILGLMLKYAEGQKTTSQGFNILELLKMRLHFAKPGRRITRYNNINNTVISFSGRTILIGNKPYDVFDKANELLQHIKGMKSVVESELANENIAFSNNPIFLHARVLFAADPKLQKIDLENGFTIYRDDIEHDNGNKPKGSTWIGHLLRTGSLYTTAIKDGYRQINIKNIDFVNRNQQDDIVKIAEEQDDQEERRRAIRSNPFDKIKGLLMSVGVEDIDISRTEDEKEAFKKFAESFFNQVLGSTKYDISDNPYFERLAENKYAVGVATSTLIKLSQYAPYTAVYHEAFHRILELLLPAETREELYSIYRKHNPDAVTDRDVAEGMADMFVDYTEKYIDYKNLSWTKKILQFYKPLYRFYKVANAIGLRNMSTFVSLYRNVYAGKFKNAEASEENKKRFRELFGDALYYEVKNRTTRQTVDFRTIENSIDLNNLVSALEYYIVDDLGLNTIVPDIDTFNSLLKRPENLLDYLSLETIDSLTAKGVPDDELTDTDLVFREVFETEYREEKTKKGKVRSRKIYPKFAAISDRIIASISSRISDYKEKVLEIDEDEDEKVQKQNIDKYDRASYEFKKLDSATARTKMFFATVPYLIPVEDENGKISSIKRDYSRNKYYTPTLMPMTEVYNKVVNDLHYIKSAKELKDALEEKAKTSPMYQYLSNKYNDLYKDIYTYDDDNNLIHIDYEKESLALQIAQTISSQKIQFVIAYSKKENRKTNSKKVQILDSSENVDIRAYPKRWTLSLLTGLTGIFSKTLRNGQYVLTSNAFNKDKVDVFKQTVSFLNELRTVFLKEGSEFSIRGVDMNKYSYNDMNLIKRSIVARFNKIGIGIDREAFDYMLEQEFGNSGYNGIAAFLTGSTATWSMSSFTNMLHNFVGGYAVNQDAIKKGYVENGLVKMLAKYQAAYQRISTDQSALAFNGKRYYTITQNHTISYITDLLASGDKSNPFIQRLLNYSYSYDQGAGFGSIIQKAIASGKRLKMSCKTYIGFRTDNRNDSGSEYTKEDIVEDFMFKLAALQQGFMIPLTLSDKGTYPIIEGVDIPGLRFTTVKENNGNVRNVVENSPTVLWVGKNAYIKPHDTVLLQMLDYANTERLSIQQCMEDLGYETIDGYQKQGRHVLKEEEKILNYHTPNIGNDSKGTQRIVEPNGTRFLSLTEIYVNEGGKLVHYNLNDPNVSSNDLLKLANEKFFNLRDEDWYDRSGNRLTEIEANARRIERQKETLAYTLALQNYKTVLYAVDQGIIQRAPQTLSGDASKTISASWDSLLNLQNVHLNNDQINVLASSIFDSIPAWKNEKPGASKLYHQNLARSLAIAAIIADGEYRSIISYNEFTRNYMGNPAFYKVDYDYEKGIIRDSSYDIQKRIGGLVSTGDDNMLDIPGLPKEYVCAECKDYKVGSTADVAGRLDDLFETGAVREAWAIATDDWKYPFTKTAKELIEEAKASNDHSIAIAVEKAAKNSKIFSDAYKSKINVTDGAAYITADMCKNLLRMRGQFNGAVEEAFNILQGEEKISWMDKKEAYKKIYDAVNIVTTKYTAFGIRSHTINNGQASDIAVPYYNKYALFPIFDCLTDGPLNQIYHKMLDENVDMMMMDSAVKLGSQGAVSYENDEIGKPFNKYTQDYGFLRRQLNTDPEEGSEITAGTQTMKIALANLRLKRDNYVWQGDVNYEISGEDLLKTYMDSINALADIGVTEVEEMFLTNGKVDPEKLSTYLIELLSLRNADEAILDALEVEDTPAGKRMSIPLAATPEASWMESILISTVNRRVIDITTPGSSFVQRSVFGTEKSRKEGEGLIQGSDKLLMINEDGSMDAVMSIDYFESILPEGLSFNEARQWLIDNGIIGKHAKANTIGYRIPTQAQSSIHAIRFVDVVPAVKSTIILPEEFTKITGSDFKHIEVIKFP